VRSRTFFLLALAVAGWKGYGAHVERAADVIEGLLATADGQQNWKSNQQKAEELYLRSLKLDHPVPMAHRGLGMLYEKMGRTREAIDEYQKYLDLASDAMDYGRIQRRIQTLKSSGD